MLRTTASLILLALSLGLATSEEQSDPDSISGVVAFDLSAQSDSGTTATGANPKVVERQAEAALAREDYATATSLFDAACALGVSVNCDRAKEIIEEQTDLDIPPHLHISHVGLGTNPGARN